MKMPAASRRVMLDGTFATYGRQQCGGFTHTQPLHDKQVGENGTLGGWS